MTTSTRTRRPVKRTCRIEALAQGLRLTMTEIFPRSVKVTRYDVERLPSDFGTAFKVRKLIEDGGDGTAYDVCLNGDDSLCGCPGFEKYGMAIGGEDRGCRHIASLQSLRDSGLI
jgi:hypothetical protein